MDITLLFAEFGKYGLPGLIILGMGYALYKQSISHKEERKEWNKTINNHFGMIIERFTANTQELSQLREILRSRKTDRVEGKKE